MYIEKAGVPLSAYEFRQEWFYHDATDVTFILDKTRKRYHKSDLAADGTSLRLTLKTLTPNFKTYQVRFDNGPWRPCDDVVTWVPQADSSRVEVKTVDQFGVEKPVSTIEVGSRAAGS
jgi:hypothetical protein